jgi:hypothetical protein
MSCVLIVHSGTSKTLTFSCNSTVEAALILSGEASNTALGQLWGYSSLYANDCAKAQIETGNLIGTAFVARDMMRIVDALESDGLLRYWGKSSSLNDSNIKLEFETKG